MPNVGASGKAELIQLWERDRWGLVLATTGGAKVEGEQEGRSDNHL